MNFTLHPWHLLIYIGASWINRHQQDAIDYLRTENQILREKLGKRRILLNDDQRRRLAVKGKVLSRRVLEQLISVATPDTLLRWHRELIARKWDYSDRRRSVGRPRIRQRIVDLVVRIAHAPWVGRGFDSGLSTWLFVSLKSECLNRMIFFGEGSLRRALREFSEHFHRERNHQGLDNRLIDPSDEVGRTKGDMECRNRLGGTLRYYYRKAA
jgi:hypothetical protein